jgi:hypothetical protein
LSPLTVRKKNLAQTGWKGDKNKIGVSAFALKSADFGGRLTPSDQRAWGVFVVTKTHLASGKITLFYELLKECILG